MTLQGQGLIRVPKLVLGAFGVVALVLSGVHQHGQDVNFDQLNYHFYSAYALLYNRLTVDAAPAGLIHSYFNPLPYVPFYVFAGHLRPRLVIFLLGVWHGFNYWLVLLIAWQVSAGVPVRRRVALCAGAVLISLASPMVLAEWASSFADITTSLLVLGGVAALLHAASGVDERRRDVSIFAGSCCVGLAIGLKLTNAIYAPGVVVFCLVGEAGWRARVRGLLLAAAGGSAGAAGSGGFWFYRLWELFRNPVFPYYDAVFRSPELARVPKLHGISFFDRQFLPRTLWQGLALPFRWIHMNATTCELPFRDMRFALLFCLLIAAALLAVAANSGLIRDLQGRRPAAAQTKLAGFFVASFAAWTYQFAIQRYLIGLELLAGPLIVVALATLLPQRTAAIAALCAGCVCIGTVLAPNFGRIKARGSWYDVRLPADLEKPGLVFLQGNEISYIVPFLPQESRAVGLTGADALRAGQGHFVDRVVRRALAEQPALPVSIILNAPLLSATRETLASYGLIDIGPCSPISTRAGVVASCRVCARRGCSG